MVVEMMCKWTIMKTNKQTNPIILHCHMHCKVGNYMAWQRITGVHLRQIYNMESGDDYWLDS